MLALTPRTDKFPSENDNPWRSPHGGWAFQPGGRDLAVERDYRDAPWWWSLLQCVDSPVQTAAVEELKGDVTVIGDSRLLACPISEHPDARLVCDAIMIAAAARGGRPNIEGVIFHSDRGFTYTATTFTTLCRDRLGVRQSMGRVGSCFDNAAAESFFSTLEHEVVSRHLFATKAQSRAVVLEWCHNFYSTRRRHSSAASMAPNEYEKITADQPAAA